MPNINELKKVESYPCDTSYIKDSKGNVMYKIYSSAKVVKQKSDDEDEMTFDQITRRIGLENDDPEYLTQLEALKAMTYSFENPPGKSDLWITGLPIGHENCEESIDILASVDVNFTTALLGTRMEFFQTHFKQNAKKK